ncbi:MAG: hypothetical protein AAB668_01030 [Patescibacteria group bacterium]
MKRFLFRSAAAISGAALLAAAAPALAAPTIGSVTPVSASANNPIIFSTTVQSSVPIQSCNLYVDLEDAGAMTVSAGTVSKSYTFPFGGSRIAFVFCRDTAGGIAAGPNTAIWVTGQLQNEPPLGGGGDTIPPPEPEPTPAPPDDVVRRLIKLVCPGGAGVDDPCRAVYYVGRDERRHAFPNSRIFFTWYQNFDTVREISLTELAAYQLGSNVRYRPGSRMVKFTTLNKVYAVERDGTLRWVKTEDVARSLYGENWNTKIDDISDVFYNDYTFGPDIDLASQYSVTGQLEANVTID